ncbi:MAG: ribbon-helix-helix domain-containing protein [Xanthobacteraceae bacterium]
MTRSEANQWRRKRPLPGSRIRRRTINITGRARKTSITLEPEFWDALREIAFVRRLPLSRLVGDIDSRREHANLSSAIRLFILNFFRNESDDLAKWRQSSGQTKRGDD